MGERGSVYFSLSGDVLLFISVQTYFVPGLVIDLSHATSTGRKVTHRQNSQKTDIFIFVAVRSSNSQQALLFSSSVSLNLSVAKARCYFWIAVTSNNVTGRITIKMLTLTTDI